MTTHSTVRRAYRCGRVILPALAALAVAGCTALPRDGAGSRTARAMLGTAMLATQDAVAPDGAAAAALIDPEMQPDPDAFSAETVVAWDGERTLQGVWIAHPEARTARRVRIVNAGTGAAVDGALFRRDSGLSGPQVLVSSDAALALGMAPGAETRLEITAIRYAPGPGDEADGARVAGAQAAPPEADRPTDPPGAARAPSTGLGTPAEERADAAADAPGDAPAEAADPDAGDAAEDAQRVTPEMQAGGGAGAAAGLPADPASEEAAGPPAPGTADPASAENAGPQAPGTAGPVAQAETADAPEAAAAPAEPQDDARRAAEPEPGPAPVNGETWRRAADGPVPADRVAAIDPDGAPGRSDPGAEADAARPERPFVQAGIFAVEGNATRLIARLRAAGLPAEGKPFDFRGRPATRVVAGPFPTAEARDAALAEVRRIGPDDAVPVRE